MDLCRGAVFADNKNRVQTFRPGQVVPMTANISIPHEGPANVSIVKTATNKIVGDMLLVFDSYADEKLKVLPPNNTQFSVTLPTNLGKQCSVAGECVLQWFWFGTAAKQTYEVRLQDWGGDLSMGRDLRGLLLRLRLTYCHRAVSTSCLPVMP